MSMARDIDSIRARLAELEAERGALNEQLEQLRAHRAQAMVCGSVSSITANSTAAEKITLFRRLFAGRSEVFPVRWENRNTGKSGYAPACANEWVRGVCGKPQVKCGECRNQAFIALSDNAADHRTKQRQIEYVNARNATPRGITGLTRCPSRGAVWSELNIRVWVVLFGSWLPSKSSLFRRYRRLDGPSRFPLG